jgi:hypothetical protein
MHPVDALPPIAVSCTDYNELVFVIGFASAKNTARFLAQMVWLLQLGEIARATVGPPELLPP